jgi:hypothetical protein
VVSCRLTLVTSLTFFTSQGILDRPKWLCTNVLDIIDHFLQHFIKKDHLKKNYDWIAADLLDDTWHMSPRPLEADTCRLGPWRHVAPPETDGRGHAVVGPCNRCLPPQTMAACATCCTTQPLFLLPNYLRGSLFWQWEGQNVLCVKNSSYETEGPTRGWAGRRSRPYVFSLVTWLSFITNSS